MHRIAASLSCLLLSSCIFDYGRCTYENRTLLMTGNLAGLAQPIGEPPIAAELALNESRNGVDYRVLGINLRGGSVMHILSVDVVDVGPSRQSILATFTAGNTMTPGYWYADLGYATRAPTHSELLRAITGRHLRLIAHYTGGETAEGNLRIKEYGNWEHPYCS
jgi:hypothetical protein